MGGKKRPLFSVSGSVKRFALTVALFSLTSGCYGTPRTPSPDGEGGDGHGGMSGTAGMSPLGGTSGSRRGRRRRKQLRRRRGRCDWPWRERSVESAVALAAPVQWEGPAA